MRPSVDLPQPDSPTRPDHLAGRDRTGRRRRPRARPALASLAPSSAGDALGACPAAARSACETLEHVDDAAIMRGTSCAWPRRDADGSSARDAAGAMLGFRRRRQARAVGARAARAEGAAGAAGRRIDGAMPGICAQRLAAPVAARHASRSARAYRDGAARSSTSSTVPCSTMRPAYITAIRSARPATTARSWRDPDQRGAGLGAAASAPRTGSAPGWSRRARWSARRR